jgi:tetratricopeptide (TPR) repeat protein
MNETTKQDGDDARAKACADRGHSYWKQGNLSAAIEWFTRALAMRPNDAWTLMRRGVARAAISDVAGAADDVNRARSMLPGEAGRSRRGWASAQLGEGIRQSLRDAALAPDSSRAEVEAIIGELNASIQAFTETLRESPESTWAHAHRGASAVLAHWLGGRFGVEPERVRGYAEQARADLDTALRLDATYTWARVFQAILLIITGANAPEGAERQACFAEAIERLKEAGHANKNFAVQRALAEMALYGREYEKVVELAWSQLAKEPDDPVSRYCLAVALKHLAASGEADAPALEELRRAMAGATSEEARRAMLAKRSRMCGMLGGLAMMEGKFEVAAEMLNDVLKYPDLDTLVFMSCDPAWAPIRHPAAGAENDPRFKAVQEAYSRLFPRRGA